MRIPFFVLKTGFLLAVATLVLFFFVQTFFKTPRFFDLFEFQYYKTVLLFNSFVLPSMYSMAAFSMLFKLKKREPQGFLLNFRYSFMALFLGSLISITVMYFYLNHIDPDSIKILTNQQLDLTLSLGTEMDKVNKLKETIESTGSREINLFSANRVYSMYLPAITVFHLFISFLLATFFKK